VYLKSNGELEAGIAALKEAGFPVIEFPIESPYDAGAEFFRWEVAISTACHILGINAFDQPDVQDSKLRTIAKIKDFQATGKLAETDLVDAANAKGQLEAFLSDPTLRHLANSSPSTPICRAQRNDRSDSGFARSHSGAKPNCL
jgi:hypothetical protein